MVIVGEDEIQRTTDRDEYKHSDSTRQEAMLRGSNAIILYGMPGY